MAAFLRLCVLLLCLALLHVSVHSIRPLADADLLPASQPQHRRLLSLISEYQFDSEVLKVIAAAASARRSLAKAPPTPPASTPAAASAPATAVKPPPSPGAHTNYVYEGY